jgi:hypothetical protein
MNYEYPVSRVLSLLNQHYDAFFSVVDIARETGQPVPIDTRGWSQIIVSCLTGVKGLYRQKGSDLAEGSDVKAANTWEAIDTPRFNGVIKSGTYSSVSDSMASLDQMPYLFFVLWDQSTTGYYRCRIWVVRPQYDHVFREMCETWYTARSEGRIISTNFQLHPPRGQDHSIIRNTCGNLVYPLLLHAERYDGEYHLISFDPSTLESGQCKWPED